MSGSRENAALVCSRGSHCPQLPAAATAPAPNRHAAVSARLPPIHATLSSPPAGFFNDAKNKVCSPCKGEGCTWCGTNSTPGHDPTVEECFGCAEGYDLVGEPPKCVKK